jgi:hypothetical protein
MNITQNDVDRFWKSVEPIPECGCMIWMKGTSYGYGNFSVKHKAIRAHRFIWIALYGEIPNGMCVLHHCDTPSCVNPHHLYLGTPADNTHDAVKRNRFRNVKKGEQHYRCKLTDKQVDEIRKLPFSSRKIAAMFNINQTHVLHIKKNLRRKGGFSNEIQN